MDSRNQIHSNDRQHLMATVQKLVYEKEEKNFSDIVKKIRRSKSVKTYPQFVK